MAKTKYNTEKRSTLNYHERVEKIFKRIEEKLKKPLRFTTKRSFEAIIFLIVFFAFFHCLYKVFVVSGCKVTKKMGTQQKCEPNSADTD